LITHHFFRGLAANHGRRVYVPDVLQVKHPGLRAAGAHLEEGGVEQNVVLQVRVRLAGGGGDLVGARQQVEALDEDAHASGAGRDVHGDPVGQGRGAVADEVVQVLDPEREHQVA